MKPIFLKKNSKNITARPASVAYPIHIWPDLTPDHYQNLFSSFRFIIDEMTDSQNDVYDQPKVSHKGKTLKK